VIQSCIFILFTYTYYKMCNVCTLYWYYTSTRVFINAGDALYIFTCVRKTTKQLCSVKFSSAKIIENQLTRFAVGKQTTSSTYTTWHRSLYARFYYHYYYTIAPRPIKCVRWCTGATGQTPGKRDGNRK